MKVNIFTDNSLIIIENVFVHLNTEPVLDSQGLAVLCHG